MRAEDTSGVGSLVRTWRLARRWSQAELADQAEVSPRHLSWIETGRARPSRQMVLVLASALEVPLRERNTLLQAAGHAPAYRELALDTPEFAPVDAAIRHLLAAHEPFGAILVDRTWTVLRANGAYTTWHGLAFGGDPVGSNVVCGIFTPIGRARILNFAEVAAATLDRLRREALAAQDPELHAMYAELSALAPDVPRWAPTGAAQLVIPLVLELGGQALRLFSTVTTLGTAVDVTASELRIESFFPADAATEAILRQLAGGASRAGPE